MKKSKARALAALIVVLMTVATPAAVIVYLLPACVVRRGMPNHPARPQSRAESLRTPEPDRPEPRPGAPRLTVPFARCRRPHAQRS